MKERGLGQMNLFSDHKISVTSDHVNHTLQFTDDIVRNFPDRLAGFDSCNRASLAIAAEFSLHCDANSVKKESFEFSPAAFIKIVRPAVILFGIAIAFIFFKMPVVSLFCLTLSLAVFTSQFVFYKKIFDPFFPKAQGYNIFGIVEPDRVAVSGFCGVAGALWQSNVYARLEAKARRFSPGERP